LSWRSLGVPGGDKIVPAINKYIKIFSKKKLPIFATRDWHPIKTRHFKDFGGVWPVHCIQNTKGAAFHPKLKLPEETIFLYKGIDPQKDESWLDDHVGRFGEIGRLLNRLEVLSVHLMRALDQL
jgi:nicotinamidase-related amidase